MIVIPAVDIKGGSAVRLFQGKPDRLALDAGSPLEAALRWDAFRPARLHIVDLDGAFEGRPANAELIKQIISSVKTPVEVGGGIRTRESAREYLKAGACRVVIGSKAAADTEFVRGLAEEFPGQVNLGLDVRQGRLMISGWVESSAVGVFELLERLRGVPLGEVIYTDISRDGMLSGPGLDSTRELLQRSEWPVIASGGVCSLEDLERLKDLGCFGAIVGRALYTGALDLAEAIKKIEGR